MKTIKTYIAKTENITRKWHLVDADRQVLGRLAVKVADILRGKSKKIYSNDVDCGDFVVVTNVKGLVLTGKKLEQKMDWTYSGYPGGLKLTPYSKLMEKNPERAFRIAVKGMLPDNKLAARQMRRLRIFKDDKHTHGAQLVNNA
ncbi:MAG: 50S ribosomal protein L13 [Elusimicrobia bacterium]|nr:50S ribosomal protein L13 [Elusimicrobiota bacterium]